MNSNAANIITVRLVRNHLFQRVVIKHAQMHIIGASNDPALSGNEFRSTNGQVGDFKRLDECLVLVVPNVNVAIVQTSEQPWFCRMEIDGLDAFAPCGEFSLNVET